jgi:hypothetical protein
VREKRREVLIISSNYFVFQLYCICIVAPHSKDGANDEVILLIYASLIYSFIQLTSFYSTKASAPLRRAIKGAGSKPYPVPFPSYSALLYRYAARSLLLIYYTTLIHYTLSLHCTVSFFRFSLLLFYNAILQVLCLFLPTPVYGSFLPFSLPSLPTLALLLLFLFFLLPSFPSLLLLVCLTDTCDH